MYIENQAPHLILNEWPMDFSAERKNTVCFFFSRHFCDLGKKKNTVFGFEWMNDQRTYPGKKNTAPLV